LQACDRRAPACGRPALLWKKSGRWKRPQEMREEKPVGACPAGGGWASAGTELAQHRTPHSVRPGPPAGLGDSSHKAGAWQPAGTTTACSNRTCRADDSSGVATGSDPAGLTPCAKVSSKLDFST